ncbi:excinuclease ABC subunit UvrA [Patescibacteria group bacterium]
MNSKNIKIRGARVNNLKNIDVDLPRNKFVVITGISGSGKSSLAFDTIYAEGQRRYVESLSAYARQFLGLMDKPDVDQIEGLSPAISIDQKSTSRNPRSTVGTITEVYDYLRLLFARVGTPHCPQCGKPVSAQSPGQIGDKVLSLPPDTKAIILSPMVSDRKGEHKDTLQEIQRAGYVRVRLNGVVMDIAEALNKSLDKQKKHTIEVVVDRLVITPKPKGKQEHPERTRVVDSVETALDLGNGIMVVSLPDLDQDKLFSERFACVECGVNLPEVQPRMFSFNSPHGACPECTGLGTKLEVDPDLVIPNRKLSISEGAIRPWSRSNSRQTWYSRILDAAAKQYKFSTKVPVNKLSKKALGIVLYGSQGKSFTVKAENGSGGKVREFTTSFEGVIPHLERRYRETDSEYIRSEIEQYMRIYTCPKCKGKRLRPEVLSVLINDMSIIEVTELPVKGSLKLFNKIEAKLTERQKKIAKQVLKEIRSRLQFLADVGLDYITLNRSANTLSGGEAQRIRLATQIGSSLVGVLYILDEPSIGLHQKDNAKLIETLKHLREIGNTVIVVEHDEETMRSADHIIDIGPGAGELGGEVVAVGTPAAITRNKKSVTGAYLSGHKQVVLHKKKRRNGNGKSLVVKGASEHNLKNIDVRIPLGKLVAITGVSGSGKSTLMNDILAKALARKFYRAKDLPGEHKAITGINYLDKVVIIDQSPIGRTPRSNPATYTGVFTYIRDLFVQTPEAKIRGYRAGRFSFNVKGGRCEACRGEGLVRIEMHFLPDVYVQCSECKGKRYNKEALEIHYKGKNIAEVLEMSVSEALSFFGNVPALKRKLKILDEVGLGYIKLGQSATTLSGGEAQRVKLATELSKRSTGKTLYILDEPTTGLHFADVEKLLHVLNQLVEKKNSVLIIEHNLDVIKSADWIIDLGPDGGDAGGKLVTAGTPEKVARVKKSYTGQYLQKVSRRK